MTLKKIDMAAVRCYNIKGGEIMELFKNENIIITDIKTVSKYEKLTDEQEFMRYLHNLPTYELIFFFDGDSRVIFGDKEMRDIPNSIRYLPKGAKLSIDAKAVRLFSVSFRIHTTAATAEAAHKIIQISGTQSIRPLPEKS